jgi:AcrR family transcriptional regulator
MERVIEAAESCIREQGFESMRMADVAARANVSVGTIYSRFPDKMALLRAIQQRVHERIEPRFLEEMAIEKERGGTLAEAAERIFTRLSRHFLDERELFSTFFMRAVLDPALKEGGQKVNLTRRKAIADALADHRDEIGHPDPELAIDMAYTTCLALIRGRLLWGSASRMTGPFSDEVLVTETVALVTAYLERQGEPA